jgi:hypothetical protein
MEPLDTNHIGNMATEPHPHHWRLFIAVLVLLGLYAAFWGLRSTPDKFLDVANAPAENQGQVTDEERASIDALRYAPPTTE